jgi:hypothetical protein
MCNATYFALASALALAGCGSTPSSTLGTGGSPSSSAATGAGGGGGAACVMASIIIEGDGPENHFDASCMGSYGATYTSHANGYLAYATHTSLDLQLDINGCAEATASPMDGSLSLTVAQTGVGNATMGTASYANGTDTFTTATEVTVMVSEITSAVVQGSYTATVSSMNSGMKMLSGTFAVCREPNYTPP